MRMWARNSARRTARAALLTAGFVALGAGTAFADVTSGDGSILGGNQVNAPISTPVDVSGNAIGIAGTSEAGSKGGTSVKNGGNGQRTSGDNSLGGGNQVNAPISAPVNACGNAIAVFGTAEAGCEGGASVKNGGKGQRTSGDSSLGGGNQVNAPVAAPINVCGNAAAVLGEALAGCEGGAKVKNGSDRYNGGKGQRTSGNSSVIGGNQANSGASTPINVCGNAGGNAAAYCEGGSTVKNNSGKGQRTSGDSSVIGGNQANAPVSVPANVCGNAAALLGDAAAGCAGVVKAQSGSSAGTTSGDSSVIGGNQVNAPVKAPIDVCGNAAAALGTSEAGCQGKAKAQSARLAAPNPVPGLPVNLPELPVTPGLPVNTGALPVNTGALPALPELPVQLPKLPVALPKLPVKTPVKAAAKDPAMPKLPVQLPVNADPVLGALPINTGTLPKLPVALPKLPVAPKLPVQPPVKLPVAKTRNAAQLPGPVGNPGVLGGLPVLPSVPGTLSNLPKAPVGLGTVTGTVGKATSQVPGHDGATILPAPALPIIGDVQVPVETPGDHLDGKAIKKTAAEQPLSGTEDAGSMYALGLAALLGVASAVMALSRRIRRASQ